MKCKIPEISWHNRDPVLSVDIQLNSAGLQAQTICRLASGGTDAHVLIWHVNRDDDGEGVELELAADLARHQRAVNTVRWSPNGEFLASGDDESVVFIWKLKAENEVINIVDADNNSEMDKEVWITLKVLRGHREDIYDLSWSPNSQFLVTGSVDNTAMLWDVHKGKSMAILDDHKGYVQGVAWDPCNQYIATMSTDRHLRVFDVNTKRVLHRISKSTLPVGENHEVFDKTVRLFHDGTLQTFFRRLCFTPDGKLLLTPCGLTDYDGATKPTNTMYIFSRYNLTQPALVLPFRNEYTVAVRCSPILYTLRPFNAEKNPPIIALPYRMIYAVATKSSVFFYDTQQAVPFAIVSNIHYTRLTDLTWSSDGTVLIVSSTDGFCSLITFKDGELGDRYEDMDAVLCAAAKISENVTQFKVKGKRNKLRKQSSDEMTPRAPLREKSQTNKQPEPIKESSDIDMDSSTHSGSSNVSSSPKLTRTSPVKPTPIAIRKSPMANPPKPLITIINTKEIISSEEKFESPEKKNRPATPIQIRRQPRTPGSGASQTPKSQANPIAVRRTPRALIAMPVNAPAVVEEALDAWPVEAGITEISNAAMPTPAATTTTSKAPTVLALSEATIERTEDIRLVYEDSQEDMPLSSGLKPDDSAPAVAIAVATPPKPASSNNKTPRRVTLRTISTPKSKKKLID